MRVNSFAVTQADARADAKTPFSNGDAFGCANTNADLHANADPRPSTLNAAQPSANIHSHARASGFFGGDMRRRWRLWLQLLQRHGGSLLLRCVQRRHVLRQYGTVLVRLRPH